MPPTGGASEDTIREAITAFQNGDFSSIRATARAYNLSEATFRRRLKGGINRSYKYINQQLLQPLQEKLLV